MKANSIEQELEAIRQLLASQRPERPELLQVLERLARAADALQQMAEDLRVENEKLLETRQAVEAERQRYLTLFEFAPDGHVVTDLSGYILEVNRAAIALLGRGRENLTGKPLAIFVADEERSVFRSCLAQLPTQSGVQGCELSFQLPTNTRLHAAVNVVALQAVGSTPTSLHWIIRDINARKQAEARAHAMLEAAPTSMVMVDSAGTIVLVNAEAERMFGYSRRELQGRRVEVLVPERFRGNHPRLQSVFLARPGARPMGAGRELFARRKDGSEFPVEIGLNPIRTEEGLFVLAAAVDISERKQGEDTVRRQQQWDEALKTIGQAATSFQPLEVILTWGAEGIRRASGASLAVVRLVDPKTKELVIAAHRGVPEEYLEVGERIPWGQEVAGAVAASGQPRMIGRPGEQPGASERSLLAGRAQTLACLPLLAGSRVLGTLTLGHERSQYFTLADLESCRPATAMLAGAILAEHLRLATLKEAEDKALLFRELDHRVRNHLAALISLLHLGAEGSDSVAADRLREMAERVARLAEVHNLLSGRGLQPIEVRELAEVIARNVLAAVPDHQVHWQVTGDPIRVPPAQVTPVALALNELLTNCAKHAFSGRTSGTVTIRIAHTDDHIEVQVNDDGVGQGPAPSAGLGKSIVQTVVGQSLRGTVHYADEGGTRVTLRFPHVETPEGSGF